jgi:Fe-S-cluster-containing dehydrogenase component
MKKDNEKVIGCVICSKGCFYMLRGEDIMEEEVMKK